MDALTLPMDKFSNVLDGVTTGISNATGNMVEGLSTEGRSFMPGYEGYHAEGAAMRGEGVLNTGRKIMIDGKPNGLRSGGPIGAGSMARVGYMKR